MAYIYDPSQNIKQEFQQAQAGVGDIFTHIIAQKQRDYNLAENTFQNIEALKKNLNIFGQKNITNKANDLLSKTSSAIQKNGKLDYSELGNLRQQISTIGDLKQGYEIGAKEYERMLQLGIANKDNLISFEKFYKELSAKMGDENLVANPQDLQQALASTYSDNLDASAMFQKSFYKQNPLKPVSQDVRNSKGQVTGIVKGEIPSNMIIDANGKAVPAIPTITEIGPDGQPKTLDYVDQQIKQIQQNNPDLWNIMKKQTGLGATIAGDRGVMDYYLSKVQPKLSPHETKSETQLRIDEANLKITESKASHIEDNLNLDKQLKLSGIAENNAQRLKALSGMQKNIPNISDLSAYGINVNSQGKSVDFGAEVKMRTSDPSNPNKTVPFKATGLRTLSNGKQELVGYISTGSVDQKTDEVIYGQQVAYYPYRKSATTSLSMAIKNLGKDKEDNIAQSIAIYNGIPVTKSQPKPSSDPSSITTPKPAAKIVYKETINQNMQLLKSSKLKLKNGSIAETPEEIYQWYAENGNEVK